MQAQVPVQIRTPVIAELSHVCNRLGTHRETCYEARQPCRRPVVEGQMSSVKIRQKGFCRHKTKPLPAAI